MILPDNDDVGRNHADKVAQSVFSIAKSVRVLEPPDLEEAGDVLNWLDLGHTPDELVDLARETSEWMPREARGE